VDTPGETVGCRAVQSPFDKKPLFFEIQNERENRSERTARYRLLRKENQSNVRRTGLRLQLACLVFAQAVTVEFAADQLEKRGGHQLLQKPKDLFRFLRFFDADKTVELNAFMVKRKGREGNCAVHPGDPSAVGDHTRGCFEPERRAAGTESAAEK